MSQARIDRLAGAFRAQDEVLYLWSGEHVKRLVPGFESLAADVYWLRTVQYYGGQRRFATDKPFDLLRPLIDITTTLDPRLEIAYRYGAIFLSEPPPTGAGRPRRRRRTAGERRRGRCRRRGACARILASSISCT